MQSCSKNKPMVLTIAANDTAGMAGIAQDIRTLSALGVHSASVITANTSQNNFEVLGINPVDETTLSQQLLALKDLPIAAVKVGLLTSIAQVKVVAHFIQSTDIPLILDPVLSSTSGFAFFPKKDVAAYVDMLLPLCTLLTPNREEAADLAYLSVNTPEEVELAAESLILMGARNVLITGGDITGGLSQDYFASDDKNFWLTSKKKRTKNTRGTGCVLSSTIAASMAKGYSLFDAVVIGKMAVNQGLRESYGLGNQKGPAFVSRFPNNGIDLPVLTCTSEVNLNKDAFPACNQVKGVEKKLGLYPIVDSADWLEDLLPLGVSTIQLRVKDLAGDTLENEIKTAIEIAQKYDARLFINDHWKLAIKYGAYGVHLGQEDLVSADLGSIRESGLRLGISTHCHHEVARAIQFKPSYIACGPVYHTNTKQMPWVPLGCDGLSYWQRVLNYPVVAIGGINQSNLADVLGSNVDGIAMISAITESDEPEETTRALLKQF